MKSGEEQALVGGGGKLELQLGKKGNLSRAVREKEELMRAEPSKAKDKEEQRKEPRNKR